MAGDLSDEEVRPQAAKAHGGDIEAWIRLPSQRQAKNAGEAFA